MDAISGENQQLLKQRLTRRFGLPWSLDVDDSYALSLLADLSVVVKIFECALATVYTGDHPSLGRVVVAVYLLGSSFMMSERRPILRELREPESQLFLHREGGIEMLCKASDPRGAFVIDAADALDLLCNPELEWRKIGSSERSNFYMGELPGLGRYELAINVVGHSYIFPTEARDGDAFGICKLLQA